jgi:hypothetical protein
MENHRCPKMAPASHHSSGQPKQFDAQMEVIIRQQCRKYQCPGDRQRGVSKMPMANKNSHRLDPHNCLRQIIIHQSEQKNENEFVLKENSVLICYF